MDPVPCGAGARSLGFHQFTLRASCRGACLRGTVPGAGLAVADQMLMSQVRICEAYESAKKDITQHLVLQYGSHTVTCYITINIWYHITTHGSPLVN